jgi:hypothetical protein
VVTNLCTAYAVSERRACRTVRCARATYYYRSHRDPRTGLRQRSEASLIIIGMKPMNSFKIFQMIPMNIYEKLWQTPSSS